MGLSRYSLLAFLLLSFPLYGFVSTKLSKMSTKQDIINLRFMSLDNKFTIYQRRSGHLLLSTNFKVIELLQSNAGSQYEVIGSEDRKKLVLIQDQDYFKNISIRKNKKIYIADFGNSNATLMGEGTSPSLHLMDTWLSYFSFDQNVLHFGNTENSTLKFQIKLQDNKNPYFIPQAVMLSENLVLYTDTDQKGFPILLKFTRSSKNFEPIYKSSSINEKIEICRYKDHLYLGLFSINKGKNSTIIYQGDASDFKLDKSKSIYESNLNDPGGIICNFSQDEIFFIKNTGKNNSSKRTELVELNLKTLQTNILSDLYYTASAFNMDGRLLIPYRGEFLLVKGPPTPDDKFTSSAALKAFPAMKPGHDEHFEDTPKSSSDKTSTNSQPAPGKDSSVDTKSGPSGPNKKKEQGKKDKTEKNEKEKKDEKGNSKKKGKGSASPAFGPQGVWPI